MQGSIVTLLIIGHPKAIIARRSDFLRISLRDRGVIAHLAFEAYCLEIDRQPQRGACKIDRRAIWDPRFPQRTGIPFPLAAISTRSASLVRKSESGTREEGKGRRMLVWKRRRRVSRRVFDRYYLFIVACLPAPVTGRSIPRTGAYVRPRLGTQPRIESDPSFLPFSPARPYSGCPKWPPQGRANWPSRIHSKSSANNSRPPDRFATNDFGEFFEYESEGTILRGENSNAKRTSWRSDPRSIDRSIHRRIDQASRPNLRRCILLWKSILCPGSNKRGFCPSANGRAR